MASNWSEQMFKRETRLNGQTSKSTNNLHTTTKGTSEMGKKQPNSRCSQTIITFMKFIIVCALYTTKWVGSRPNNYFLRAFVCSHYFRIRLAFHCIRIVNNIKESKWVKNISTKLSFKNHQQQIYEIGLVIIVLHWSGFPFIQTIKTLHTSPYFKSMKQKMNRIGNNNSAEWYSTAKWK